MSFEHYIQEIQQRSPREQRTIVLVATTAVFVPLMVVLFFLGAFSFRDTGGASASDTVGSLKERAAPTLNEFSAGLNSMTASTSEALEALRALASSTRQMQNSTTTSSTTQDGGATSMATSSASSTAATDTDISE